MTSVTLWSIDGEAGAEQAEAGEDGVGAARRASPSIARGSRRGRRACRRHASVEMDRRVDAERDRTVAVDGAGLALGVRADERDGVGVRRVVLDVARA